MLLQGCCLQQQVPLRGLVVCVRRSQRLHSLTLSTVFGNLLPLPVTARAQLVHVCMQAPGMVCTEDVTLWPLLKPFKGQCPARPRHLLAVCSHLCRYSCSLLCIEGCWIACEPLPLAYGPWLAPSGGALLSGYSVLNDMMFLWAAGLRSLSCCPVTNTTTDG